METRSFTDYLDDGKTFSDLNEKEKEQYREDQQKISEDLEIEKKAFEDFPYSNDEIEEVMQKFKDPDLLNLIKNEISKDHLEDDNLKMTLFNTEISALLPNPKRRMSMVIKGKTAEGKDNAFYSTLKHIPKEAYMFLTSGTRAVFEDDIKDIPLVVISEVNLFKEGGANKDLLEVIKQRTEGGTSAIKKDLREKNKEARHEEGKQGSVIFGTTDIQSDEELDTRCMTGTIKATFQRIKKVNEYTFDLFSSEEKLVQQINESDSWIKKGLTYFWKKEPKLEVVIPYAKFLKEKINGKEIFDHSDPRSQRDIKRLLSLTCAMTWIFQEQRQKKEVKGIWFLISEPQDIINTLKHSNEFFNRTYSGIEERLNKILDFLDSKPKDLWIDKLDIQEHIGVKHRDTINKYLWELEQKGFIERSKGVHLNERFGLKTYKGNHIYYTSVQKVFNKRLISVQLNELKKFLEERSVQKSVQNDQDIVISTKKEPKTHERSIFKGEIEHLKLNTSNKKDPEYTTKNKTIEVIKI